MISVIIPALNEARRLPDLLKVLLEEKPRPEIIIVDGGSVDKTLTIAESFGVQALCSRPNRGVQLDEGAKVARGNILLFLHADSVFPKGGLAALQELMDSSSQFVGGNFRLLFEGDRPFTRWLGKFYVWIRKCGEYYGDSGIFVRRAVYHELGGFRSLPVMEDFDFTQRMEKFGQTCCVKNPPLVTSSRRFTGRHPIAICCGWIWIHILYRLDVSPQRLGKTYEAMKPKQEV